MVSLCVQTMAFTSASQSPLSSYKEQDDWSEQEYCVFLLPGRRLKEIGISYPPKRLSTDKMLQVRRVGLFVFCLIFTMNTWPSS